MSLGLRSWGAHVLVCLVLVMFAIEPALAFDVAAPKVESRARVSLQVHLDTKQAWAAVMQTVNDSQGKLLVVQEKVGFVSFYYDLATRLFPWSFVNANLLVRRLTMDEEPAIKLLRRKLSAETQAVLSGHRPETYPSECLLNLLVDDFNRVIGGEALAPEKSLVPGASSAAHVLDQALKNRRWLEDALPDSIRAWPGDLAGPRRIVVCNVLVIPDDDGRTSSVYFSSWQAGAPTALSYGSVFLGSLERFLKGKACASGS